MGFAYCRFNQDMGCEQTGSQEWYVRLPDVNRIINVPSMWKHYMADHLIQPTAEEREVILAADSALAVGEFFTTRSVEPELLVLYVERLGQNRYTHQIGTTPDIEFMGKLEKILANIQPLQSKGLSFKPGYR